MNAHSCDTPLSFADMADYLLGELPTAEEQRLEEHLFGCGVCARKMEVVESLGAGIRTLVRRGFAGGVVNHGFIDTARREGLTVREYRLTPGATVSCIAGPEDFVLVRVAAPFADAEDVMLKVVFRDLERGESAPELSRAVDVDREAGEILLLFPGEEVRRYPRSRWTLNAHGRLAGKEVNFGPFVLDHSPADRGGIP